MSRGSRFIVGPAYDAAFFLLPPAAALLAGIAISGTAVSNETFELLGEETTLAAIGLGAIIHAHLVAVFFRSHGNPQIFRRHPVRFVLVPLVLWLGIVSSSWIAITASVVATFWDVWHSGAQTFGLVRIYERNAGSPAALGRRLDFWLNQLLYAGPILAGVTLVDHLDAFEEYGDVGDVFFTHVPARVLGVQRWLTWAVAVIGVAYLAFYVWAHVQFARRGHRPSWPKVWLLVSTGACSLYTWGWNSWGEAFFIMNLFHAVQYLALVWASERGRLIERLRLGRACRGPAIALTAFLGLVLAYGLVAKLGPSTGAWWSLTLTVSLMHFWYDGFVWSVRKGEV